MLASVVRNRGTSRSQIQASAAVTNGPVAMMIATFETSVSCRAGMKHTMPSVDSDATSQPVLSIPAKSRRPARPCVSTRMKAIMTAAEQPAPEQDRPGIERQQPREERRGAPGNRRGDDEGDPRAMLRLSPGHSKSCLLPGYDRPDPVRSQVRARFSTLAMRSGTPNSLRQTSASTATPSRICSCEGLAKHSRSRLPE